MHCCKAQATNPGDWPETGLLLPARRPYSVLLRVGFAMRMLLPAPRCALTAPFHPYPGSGPGRSALCGTFPGLREQAPRPAGVTRHPCFMEPGLSSEPCGHAAARPPGGIGLACFACGEHLRVRLRHQPAPPPGHPFQNILPMGGRAGGAGRCREQGADAPCATNQRALPRSRCSSSSNSSAQISPSTSPVIRSGRQRRSNARTAAGPSVMS